MKNEEIINISDEWILNNIFDSRGRINANMTRQQYLDAHPILKDYLYNRYRDSESITENIYRIKNNIDVRPICKHCGGHIIFYGPTKGYQVYCSNKCSCPDKNRLEKCKETCNKNYGCDWPAQNNEIFNVQCQTKFKKYGYAYGNIHEKMVEKYGVNAPIQITEIKNKISSTIQRLYNAKWYLSSNEINNIRCNKEILQKIYNTKKKNHTFKSSKIEQQFREYLEQNYPNDFEYQYNSELYPFNCDFYIKSLNLYIEIQGSWTHGEHQFDENNQDDIDKLNLWKSKNTQYYNNAIETWTIRDVNKRNIAIQNNLNYLEIFTKDINKCIDILNKYIKVKYN